MTSRGHTDTDFSHPILEDAWEYEVVGLRLEKDPLDEVEAYLDLTLKKGTERRTLRFWSPADLQVERGGPVATGGLDILDIRRRGMENVGVSVTDIETSRGSVTFLARAVEELALAGQTTESL